MLAFGAATGGAARLGPAALRQGAKYLGKTDIAGALGPQINEIVDTVRGELLDAAKGAAAAAVTSRIDSLSDSLHERAETLRNPEAAVGKAGEAAGEAAGRAGDTVGRAGETVGRAGRGLGGLRRRGRGADQEEDAGFEQDEEPEEELRNGRGRRRPSPVRRGARSQADEDDEPQDDYDDEEPLEDEADEEPADEGDEEEAEEPAPRRRRTTRSPVARTRR
jgi:hypothetical protein